MGSRPFYRKLRLDLRFDTAQSLPGDILDELFVRAVARKPSEAEKKKLMPLLASNDRKAYDDVFWALLNSTEFEFNH